MKITDSSIIQNGEGELLDAITADIDWGVIEEIFKKEHHLGIDENVEYKQGDIVAYNNQVVYKLDFQVNVTLSILLDRDGNTISVTSSGDYDESDETIQADATDETTEVSTEIPDENDIKPEGLDEPETIAKPHGEGAPTASEDIQEREENRPGVAESDLSEPPPDPSSAPSDKSSNERIEKMASQIGEIITELDSEKNDVTAEDKESS